MSLQHAHTPAHTVSHSFTPSPVTPHQQQQSFSTCNLLLYVCVVNPLISFYCFFATIFRLLSCRPGRAAEGGSSSRSNSSSSSSSSSDKTHDLEKQMPVTQHYQHQQHATPPRQLSRNDVLVGVLGTMALAHLHRVRVRIVNDNDDDDDDDDDGDDERDIDEVTIHNDNVYDLLVAQRGSLSTTDTADTAGPFLSQMKDDESQHHLAAAATIASPERAHTRTRSQTFAGATQEEVIVRRVEQRPRLEFRLGRLVVMHLLTPIVAVALVFGGLAGACMCMYSVFLGEKITAEDTAYLWKTWAWWVLWPAEAVGGMHVRVVPTKGR